MNNTITLRLAALLLVPLAANAAPLLPPFSWDKVPVYAHVGKTADDFTPAELDFLAQHFDFMTFEKGQAFHKYGDTESGFAAATRQIKQRNPRAIVLFYWSTFVDIPRYQASRDLPAAWHLQDRWQQPVLVWENRWPTFDLAVAGMRNWWSDTAAAVVKASGADGVFADELGAVTAPGKRQTLGEEKYLAQNTGLVTLLDDTRRKLGPDKIIIYNGLRGTEGREFLPLTSGAKIEHFGHFADGLGKQRMAEDMDSMRTVAQSGKIVCFKAWPGFSWLDSALMKQPHAELARLARERLMFPLACFLVAAEPNCYFCYTWGYTERQGTFDWYPEFDHKLGPPQGPARRSGWLYQRDFAHAAVRVDLETQAASIEWRP